MAEGKLLYAIILRRGAEEQRGGASSAPQHLGTSAQEAPLQQCAGIADAPLETVSYRDLAAVISTIDLEKFKQKQEGCLQADMVRYQQVNLALLPHYTVLPMRFGFTARDREQVEEVLEKTYLQLRTLLNKLTGKVELVVQAYWDLPKILRGIMAQDENILQEKRETVCDQQSMTNEQRAVAVGRRLFEAAEAMKKELVAVIHAHLSQWAIDSSKGPLKPLSDQTGPERGRVVDTAIGVERIFNRSYLVKRENEHRFDVAMGCLSTRYEELLSFSYIGPLPAYSFTNIEFNQGNFALIDWARKTLALPEQASLEAIKGAYRRLAFALHPDRHPEVPQAEERFKAVTYAYEILETYCHNLQKFCGETSLHSFAREQVERTFVVKERR
jgi:hypothetical protein